ncbi:UPF0175 family protein [Halalkalicoccus jeotgali]|uniref:Uncharacterized protein n=1 Tax=Halalkalicoccus jeotgali (strain DSM 18796 / CECT 7217 / JCM 14584 / KCTC 4019 / B3) TaxID=795797 RepID=D8JDA1_HALJB|nr:UPF0175 family protein [Halalkalicoccus jeotgali]ADJ17254.1 hypothetical protein HacjB3_19593 [Halalkalicoccus jeotgali B3]ELY41941.1 hypothetical protein C497_00025 [Halalkalicoccus jeotgali B3]
MCPSSLETAGKDKDLATIIGLYVLEELTLGQAAERLEISRFEMREILHEGGVELRLGPKDIDDASSEIDVALNLE